MVKRPAAAAATAATTDVDGQQKQSKTTTKRHVSSTSHEEPTTTTPRPGSAHANVHTVDNGNAQMKHLGDDCDKSASKLEVGDSTPMSPGFAPPSPEKSFFEQFGLAA